MDEDNSFDLYELLQGKSISQFPLERYLNLKKALLDEKINAIKIGQLGRVKRIQEIFDQIEEFEKKSLSVKRIKKKHIKKSALRHKGQYQSQNFYHSTLESGPQPKQAKFTQIDKMIQDLLNGNTITNIPEQSFPLVLNRLKSLINEFSLSNKLVMAQTYQDLYNFLIQNYQLSHKVHKNSYQHTLEYQLSEAKAALYEQEKQYRITISHLENEFIQKLNDIEIINQKELDDFDKDTSVPLPPFSKPLSVNLVNMKHKEQTLIRMHNFSQANKLHQQVELKEELELERDEENRLKSRMIFRNQLQEFHQKRTQAVELKFQRKLAKINAHFELIFASIKNRINFLASTISHSSHYQHSGEIKFSPPKKLFYSTSIMSQHPNVNDSFSYRHLNIRSSINENSKHTSTIFNDEHDQISYSDIF